MCKLCENIFLLEVIESATVDKALEQFRQEHKMYDLPVTVELVEEVKLIGYWTFTEHLEQIESQFRRELRNQEKPLNKLYVYTSELLRLSDRVAVLVRKIISNKSKYVF